jgi:hypothetical protein
MREIREKITDAANHVSRTTGEPANLETDQRPERAA